MPSSNPSLTLEDIVENIDRFRTYTTGKSEQDFSSDTMLIDATERCLRRISEAAVKLGEDAETLVPGMPWRDIRGVGNHLRHGYRGVRVADIWHIVAQELAPLRAGCIDALQRLKTSQT